MILQPSTSEERGWRRRWPLTFFITWLVCPIPHPVLLPLFPSGSFLHAAYKYPAYRPPSSTYCLPSFLGRLREHIFEMELPLCILKDAWKVFFHLLAQPLSALIILVWPYLGPYSEIRIPLPPHISSSTLVYSTETFKEGVSQVKS